MKTHQPFAQDRRSAPTEPAGVSEPLALCWCAFVKDRLLRLCAVDRLHQCVHWFAVSCYQLPAEPLQRLTLPPWQSSRIEAAAGIC